MGIRASAAILVGSLVSGAAAAKPAPSPAAEAKTAVSVIGLDGLKQTMRKHRGRVVLLHFWATWCLPCLDELPMMSELAKQLKPRGLEVLSLSLDDPATGGPKVGRMLRGRAPHLTATIVRADDIDRFISSIDSQWGGAIPALFAFDQKGELRGSYIGEATRAQVEQLVGYLLKAPPGGPRASGN